MTSLHQKTSTLKSKAACNEDQSSPESRMAIEEVFGVYKNSSKIETLLRWRKVVREK